MFHVVLSCASVLSAHNAVSQIVHFLSESVAVSKECLVDNSVSYRDRIEMKIYRFVQLSVSFVERHFDGIINQSRNVKTRAMCKMRKYRWMQCLVISLLPKSLQHSPRSSKNLEMLSKWPKALQNRENV